MTATGILRVRKCIPRLGEEEISMLDGPSLRGANGSRLRRPDDKLRDEGIQFFLRLWIASRACHRAALCRDPLACNDG